MQLFRAVFLTFSLLGFLLVAPALVPGDDALPSQLQELERLRRGRKTPFAEVENRARQLLQEHPSEEDQGQIYYQLAHTYAQGDISVKERAEATIHYAQKALGYPLDPMKRLRLYVYWGDCLRVADRKRPFPQRRKAAATVYLKGFKEAQQYKIPDEPPQKPLLMLNDVPSGGLVPSEGDWKREQEEALASHEQWLSQRELWLCRKVLVGQIVEVYCRKPHAATELRELATPILQDADAVAAFMKRLEEKGALKDDEPEKVPLKPRSRIWFVIVTIHVVGVLVFVVVYVLARKRRQARSLPPGSATNY